MKINILLPDFTFFPQKLRTITWKIRIFTHNLRIFLKFSLFSSTQNLRNKRPCFLRFFSPQTC